ncbi:hypothetical protein ALC53_08844, partial [Atta colombica]
IYALLRVALSRNFLDLQRVVTVQYLYSLQASGYRKLNSFNLLASTFAIWSLCLVASCTICKRNTTLITLLRDITKRILRTFDHQTRSLDYEDVKRKKIEGNERSSILDDYSCDHSYSVLFAIKQDYSLISSLSRSTLLGYLIKELQTLVLS